MERCFKESLGINVKDRCLLDDYHGFFSHNGDQLILGDELESLMKGRHDCTCYMQLGPPKKHIVWKVHFNHLEVDHEESWADLNH